MRAERSHRSSNGSIQAATMSVQEAMEMLYSQFSDKVAIDKAFQMLGKRSKITVSVSDILFNFNRYLSLVE